MIVIGKFKLAAFLQLHADARAQVWAWIAEAEEATWQSPIEVRERYPQTSFPGKRNAIFNIKGNYYRLHVKISYKSQVITVKRIGTHSEYDTWIFEE